VRQHVEDLVTAGAEILRPGEGAQPNGEGVAFPSLHGRRSTTTTGRATVADAAAAIDAELGRRVAECGSWRDGYIPLLHELTAACGRTPEAPLQAAEAGLASLHARLVFERDSDVSPLGETLERLHVSSSYGTGVIRGTAEPLRELRVPYRGDELRGSALSEQLERWVAGGIVEPSFAKAISLVADHPEWLSLPGRLVALVGAAAELSPLEPLSAWGANVVAIDLPRSELAKRIAEIARAGAGEVTVPLASSSSQGANVVTALPEVHRWLLTLAEQDALVLGMYAYADGGAHVRASAAFDALAAALLSSNPEVGLAFLGTPTDAYLVPQETVDAAREAYASRRLRKLLQAPLQLLSGGRLFAPAYRGEDRVADVLIKQQGVNYALAKRVQRWRALLAQAHGHQVSFNVAPASWTRSVTKNRVLRAAYAGAHRHGIEIFSADTCRVLMAALLVHDLNQPAHDYDNPELLISEAAAHGGLWRAAYEPRSVLGFAAVMGLPAMLVGHRPVGTD
jgi:hypothetical protein